MWNPGTFIYAQSRKSAIILERLKIGSTPDYDAEFRPRYALVISVHQTGYGTKGYKWDAVLLCEGAILVMRACHLSEDRFNVYDAPKGK